MCAPPYKVTSLVMRSYSTVPTHRLLPGLSCHLQILELFFLPIELTVNTVLILAEISHLRCFRPHKNTEIPFHGLICQVENSCWTTTIAELSKQLWLTPDVLEMPQLACFFVLDAFSDARFGITLCNPPNLSQVAILTIGSSQFVEMYLPNWRTEQ